MLCCYSYTLQAQNEFNPAHYYELNINFSLEELDPEAIQCAVIDFDPIENFMPWHSQDYLDRRLKEANNEEERNRKILSSIIANWNFLFKHVTGNDVFLVSNRGANFAISSSVEQSPDKWLVSKVFMIDNEPYCFAAPLEAENNASLECTFDKSTMISLLELYNTKRDQENQ